MGNIFPMTMQLFESSQRAVLIQSLCRSLHAGQAPPSTLRVFAEPRHTPNFHCTSFFRTEQVAAREYDAWQPFSFKDGRVYEVLDIKLVCGQSGGVARRC